MNLSRAVVSRERDAVIKTIIVVAVVVLVVTMWESSLVVHVTGIKEHRAKDIITEVQVKYP